MPFGVGVWEILVLLLVALLVFGPKKLPEMGKQLGRGMREFKNSISGKDDEEEERALPSRADEKVEPPRAPEDETELASTASEQQTKA